MGIEHNRFIGSKLSYALKKILGMMKIQLTFFSNIKVEMIQSFFVFSDSLIFPLPSKEIIIILNKMNQIHSLILLLKINATIHPHYMGVIRVESQIPFITRVIFG